MKKQEIIRFHCSGCENSLPLSQRHSLDLCKQCFAEGPVVVHRHAKACRCRRCSGVRLDNAERDRGRFILALVAREIATGKRCLRPPIAMSKTIPGGPREYATSGFGHSDPAQAPSSSLVEGSKAGVTDKKALAAAYADSGISRARSRRNEHEVMVGSDVDGSAYIIDQRGRKGSHLNDDQHLVTATMAGRPDKETITREAWEQLAPLERGVAQPVPVFPGATSPDYDADDTDIEVSDPLATSDTISDDDSTARDMFAADIDGEDGPSNWEIQFELKPYDELKNTGLCSECNERPAFSKGLCGTCRKRKQRASASASANAEISPPFFASSHT